MNKLLDNKKIYIIVLVLLTAFALVSLVQGLRNACRDSQDFQWDAAKVLVQKINPYDESLIPSGILDKYGYDEYYLQMEANQFPSLLLILAPFTLLKPLTARYVWLILNLILTLLMIFLLKMTFLKEMETRNFILLMLFMLAGTPYRNQIGVGQHTIFSFCFFLLAVYISEYCELFKRCSENQKYDKIRFWLIVVCLFICYFKYTLTVPLVLYFIYKKRYMEIAVSAMAHVLLTVFSAIWLNDSVLNMIIKPLKVSSALSAEGGLDFGVLLKGSFAANILMFAVMLLLLALAVKMPDGHSEALIAVLILWSLIVIYHRTYDFFVLSAVAGIFFDELFLENKKLYNIFLYAYYFMLISVFFILRVFSESVESKMFVGTVYYIFTIAVSVLVFRNYFISKENRKIKNGK